MTYRDNKKARKLWSQQANEKQARMRENTEHENPVDIDHYMKITIERRATNEIAVFELSEGDRIDNYTVVCNGDFKGIQSITTLSQNIRKALPRFRRMD